MKNRFQQFLIAALFLIFSSLFAQLQYQVAFPNLSFTRPVDLQHAGDNTNRVFVVEQRGVIYVFNNDSTTAAKTS
jgi:hypothetical protein